MEIEDTLKDIFRLFTIERGVRFRAPIAEIAQYFPPEDPPSPSTIRRIIMRMVEEGLFKITSSGAGRNALEYDFTDSPLLADKEISASTQEQLSIILNRLQELVEENKQLRERNAELHRRLMQHEFGLQRVASVLQRVS